MKVGLRPPCGPVRITRIIARLNIGGPAVHIASLMGGLDPGCFENHLIVGRPGRDEGDMSYLLEARGLAPPIVIPVSTMTQFLTVMSPDPTPMRV